MTYCNKLTKIIFTVAVTISFIFISGTCFAQINNGRQLNMSQQFRLGQRIIRVAEPGQLADSINVWGDVNSPGRYLVPLNTTLPQIISYAFGPQMRSTRSTQLAWSKRRIEVAVSDYDPATGEKSVTQFVYKFGQPLPEGMRTFELDNNDVVSVRIRRKPSFKDYIRVIAPTISAIATGVLLVLRLSD